jgi:hypothetical protein
MPLFLLTFDRNQHHATVERLDDQGDAMHRLLEAEGRLRYHPELEIVLLTAADADDLRRTHARYFESTDELLELA